jgi:hypothetical protein
MYQWQRQMNRSKDQQDITFDHSTIDACLGYLKDRTDKNLERLISMAGSRLAYNHQTWSSMGSRSTIKEFWKKNLEQTVWSKQLEDSINAVMDHLTMCQESQWLDAVLEYLPEGHVFRTTVHLIVGYDNIVYGEDVALNMNFKQFHVDHREVIYYLIHELAHAGYFRYRGMPELARMRSLGDLSDVVKLLTHLEGMGVTSPMKLRLEEGGLLDGDYKVLLNDVERNKRVRDYFSVLSRLEISRSQRLHGQGSQVFEQMSGRTTRLWYVTGCHMAQRIEQEFGVEMLRKLVERGHQEFFETYRSLENPPAI